MSDPTLLLRFLGRFHVVLVHFPIALLMVAAWFEFVGRAVTQETRRSTARKLLLLGTLAAAVAASTGWWTAAAEPQSRAFESTLFWHRWTSVSVASLGLVAWLAAFAAGRPAGLKTYRVALVLSALLVGVTGHLGGSLVHGDGFLTEAWGAADSTTMSAPSVSAGSELGASSVDYVRDVVPILSQRCYSCHGPAKAKGKLRVHLMAPLFAGPEARWLIRPGQAGSSELIRRVELPEDDLDIMPGKGPPLTPAQIATLRAWIDAGAKYDDLAAAAAAATAAPAKAVPAVTSARQGGAGNSPAPIDSAAAGPAFVEPDLTPQQLPPDTALVLEALASRGILATPLGVNSTDIAVDFSKAGLADVDSELARLDGLQESLTTLDLSHTTVTDAGLAALSDFTALQRLRLDHTTLGDGALVHLSRLPALHSLNLVETQVSDAGLAQLSELTELRRLYLWRSRCTAGGAAALQSSLPHVTISLGDA